MNAKEKYQSWINNSYFDQDTKKELLDLSNNEKEITERFCKDLEFGTGGLRGVLGAGTNRMNQYTVRRATQGLANLIIKEQKQKQGVVIAYDSRHMSPEFSREAALCLMANGIKTYTFASLRPTPVLSFAVRTLGCIAGIVITASHNPPEYNGYKVYWEDGAQITGEKCGKIMEEINALSDWNQVRTMCMEEAKRKNLYHVLDSEIDDRYMEELKRLVLRPDLLQQGAGRLKIVYTPLHGTGSKPVQRILRELGFTKVSVVKEQEKPDGDFPTVKSPNPEEKSAFHMALMLAKKVDADIVLATDPDADRLGAYVKDAGTGEYLSLTGNMSGALILHYILSQKKDKNLLPSNGAVVSTIVSGKMAKKIAESFGMAYIETLTGFKYIGEQIHHFEVTHDHEYIFGFEESYGCLPGTYVRDKDAVAAAMCLCETAVWCAHQHITLYDYLQELYKKYGYYREWLLTISLKGIDGSERIQKIMKTIRRQPPTDLGGYRVMRFRDYEKRVQTDFITGKEELTSLPQSNVLYFELEREAWCCFRPSGTEPKLKIYFGIKGKTEKDAEIQLTTLKDAVKNFINIEEKNGR